MATQTVNIDEHGNEILCEAKQYQPGLCASYYFVIYAMTLSILCIPLGVFFTFQYVIFVLKWRVYVTSRGVWYSNLYYPFTGKPMSLYPMEDIRDVEITTESESRQQVGTHITIKGNLPDNHIEYINTDLSLGPMTNSEEFVAAIKEELAKHN